MTYAERRALQEGPQPPKRAPRTTPLPERPVRGLSIACPRCRKPAGVACEETGLIPRGTHIARMRAEEVSQS
jgi:hypothetical protein